MFDLYSSSVITIPLLSQLFYFSIFQWFYFDSFRVSTQLVESYEVKSAVMIFQLSMMVSQF